MALEEPVQDQVRRVAVVGAALSGPGYPNARQTLDALVSSGVVGVDDRAVWLPHDFHLWTLIRGPQRGRVRGFLRLAHAVALAVVRMVPFGSRQRFFYLPYPSLPTLWLLSWLPRQLRPRCIVDAYITLWDTLFQDRRMGASTGLVARLLFAIEARSLGVADHLVVDTIANADHMHRLFGVPLERIHALPLAVEPMTLPAGSSDAGKNGRVRVVFMGTFVPLQGTPVIAQAINALRSHDNLEFVVIGDGQQATAVEAILEAGPHVTWYRGWQSPEVLARELAQADICLGVFGGAGKAARVLPFKIYMALAAGKAIITQAAYSVPEGCPAIPAITCAPDAQSLASAIVELAKDVAQRAALSEQAKVYFQTYLSREALAVRWQQLLAQIAHD